MATVEWSASFEASPSDADSRKQGDDRFRELKLAIRERAVAGGHFMQDSVSPFLKDGLHVRGIGASGGPWWFKSDAATVELDMPDDTHVHVADNLTVDNDIAAGHDITVANALTVTGVATLNGNPVVNGAANFVGNSTFNGTVTTNGQVTTLGELTVDGELRFKYNSNSVKEISASYTVAAGVSVVLADTTAGSYTVTLPAATGNNRIIIVKKWLSSANTLTVGVGGSFLDNVSGGTVTSGAGSYGGWIFMSRAALGWYNIAKF